MSYPRFVPLYDHKELEKLLSLWAAGSLDSIASPHGVAVGVEDCDYSPQGFRPMSLLSRYTSEEVELVLFEMAIAPAPWPQYTAILIAKSLAKTPLSDLARSLGVDCSLVQGYYSQAQDEFMRRLMRRTSSVGGIYG